MSRIVCFGEILLRLTPPDRTLLLQGRSLDLYFGGAEANVAVSYARFGGRSTMASVVPDNDLGRAALNELRSHGVDISGIQFGAGRLGLYFVTPGAVLRPTEVLYDRAHSAFALAAPDAIDWPRLLEGAKRLHLSGVTPALGPNGAAAAQRAIEAASRQGIPVSFDGNHRAKLWAAWDGDAPSILRGLFAGADLAFADERDIALVLGETYDASDPRERRRMAAKAAFAAFPKLQRIVATERIQHGVEAHEIGACMHARAGEIRAQARALPGIVDRIGAGDAFAAGFLFGLMHGMDDAAALEFGLAATCLKHGIRGDFNLAGRADVEALLQGGGFDVRR